MSQSGYSSVVSTTLERELNKIGVVPTSGGTPHQPVRWPEPKRTGPGESLGWKPTKPGEEPPF